MELGIGLTRQRELMCKGPEVGSVCCSEKQWESL